MTLCLSCWIPGNLAYADAGAAATAPNEISSAGMSSDGTFQLASRTKVIAVSNVQPHTSSVQDLSIFGVISLGIMGLIWVRRHTTEL
ncbi:MAG: hypothetical protein O6766_00435 [Gammaproteobacteria bacterium]|nr:hypothetical protein [Gammaproteobacteria bacterium]